MDNKKLAEYLYELVRFRNNEQVQKEEFNHFTETEASYYQNKTDEIYKLACECDSKSNKQQCSAHQLTLDDAIEHANEVAITEECEQCAAEHKQLADWLSELKDIKNKYAYLAADFDNYKKRTASSEKYAHDKAYEYVITDMLTTYDDLEYLVKELDKRMSPEKMVSATIEDPLQVGVHVIFKNLNKTLTKLGCEKIECTYGDKFDVSTMEAIAVREIQDDEGYDPDDVVEIYRSGWKLNGKVIRPVKVVVGKDKVLSEDGTKETKEEKVL